MDARRGVGIERCKPCDNPHDSEDMPKYLAEALTQYVLMNFSNKSPQYHVNQDNSSIPPQRLDVEKITGHPSIRGQGGVTTVLYTRRTEWDSPNFPWSEKWTCTSPAPSSRNIGHEPRTKLAKPTAFSR